MGIQELYHGCNRMHDDSNVIASRIRLKLFLDIFAITL